MRATAVARLRAIETLCCFPEHVVDQTFSARRIACSIPVEDENGLAPLVVSGAGFLYIAPQFARLNAKQSSKCITQGDGNGQGDTAMADPLAIEIAKLNLQNIRAHLMSERDSSLDLVSIGAAAAHPVGRSTAQLLVF